MPLGCLYSRDCLGQEQLAFVYSIGEPLTEEESAELEAFQARQKNQQNALDWLNGSMDCDADAAIRYVEEHPEQYINAYSDLNKKP